MSKESPPVFKKRGEGYWYGLIVVSALLAVLFKSLGYAKVLPIQGTIIDDAIRVCIIFSAIGVGELLRRIVIYLAEERLHVKQRHSDSHSNALVFCLAVPDKTKKILLMTLVFLALAVSVPQFVKRPTEFYLFLSVLIVTSALSQLFQLKELSDVELCQLSETKNKHLAAALAQGYYHGYLSKVLPDIRKTEIMIGKEEVHVNPVLHIIIPKDCHTVGKLDVLTNNNEANITIAYEKIVTKKEQDDCGVTKKYKQSLYSLTPKDGHREKRFIVAEYASPVANLLRMRKAEECQFKPEDLTREVELFYKKLREILMADQNCHNKYRFILTKSVTDQLDLVENLYKAAAK